MTYTQEKQLALEAAIKAASLCMAVRAEMVGAESLEKGDKSPVTVADFGSQALVCQHIKATFPHDPIVGEEDSTDLQQADNANTLAKITQFLQSFHPGVNGAAVCEWIDSGNGRVGERFWTLDPIDGTKGFLRNDQYAVALALIEHGEPQVAVLACPALPIAMNNPHLGTGVLFLAVRGEGASMAPLSVGADLSKFRPIQVTRQDNPLSFRFAESVEAGHGDHERQQAIAKAAGITQASLRMDSQAKYGAVARGDAVLYLRLPSPKSPNYREKIWDHAAGALIVQEAGGMVTDMHGKPLDFSSSDKMEHNQGVVVSNGAIHAAVITALNN